MSGTGGQLYSALSNNLPSAAEMLKAYRLYVNSCPFIQINQFVAIRSIMEAFAGASRVHVVDYGILYGAQWPCLIHHLSIRPEGPPHLRITGTAGTSVAMGCPFQMELKAIDIVNY